MKTITKAAAWEALVESINELMEELGQEPGEIASETMLFGDLGLTSVDAIHLMVGLEDRLGRSMNMKDLISADRRNASDISLGELLDLVCRTLQIAR